MLTQEELAEKHCTREKEIKDRIKYLEGKLDALFLKKTYRRNKEQFVIYFKEIHSTDFLNKSHPFIEGWDRWNAYAISEANIYFTPDVIEDILARYRQNGYNVFFGKNFLGKKYFKFIIR